MTGRSTSSSSRLDSPAIRVSLLVAYYLLVQLAVFLLYAQRDFSAPDYIYQAF